MKFKMIKVLVVGVFLSCVMFLYVIFIVYLFVGMDV